MREFRSQSLDIRLGDDYSQLLKFQYDVNIASQKQAPTLEEGLNNTAEKIPEVLVAPVHHEPQESLDSEVQAHQAPPSPPRAVSPPSPTSPTSPPSPVSPASPNSPSTPASCINPPAQPESRPTAGKPEQQRDEETKKDNKDVEDVVATTSSAAMFVDVCPKTASNSVYSR